jgi:hypothetical protein
MADTPAVRTSLVQNKGNLPVRHNLLLDCRHRETNEVPLLANVGVVTMNQPNQQKPNQGMQDKDKQKGQSGQQVQQGNRPGQGGYSSPGQSSHSQSAPSDKK